MVPSDSSAAPDPSASGPESEPRFTSHPPTQGANRVGTLGRAGTFRSLRHRNYRLYFFGQMTSLTGTWVQTTALMWLAFELTHQSKWPALVTTAQILPTFLLGPWGGTLADRLPKRSLIFATQLAYLLLASLLTVLTFSGAVAPWQLLAVTLASGVVQAVDLPARLAFAMELVGREDLMNAVALNSLQFNVARALGPALGGVLLVQFGPGPCFLANALSYGAVLLALASMNFHVSPIGPMGPISPIRMTNDLHGPSAGLLAGFAFLLSKPPLAFLIGLTGLVALCGWPFLTLLPALAKRQLAVAEQGYSWMLSGTGVGALTAALTVATFGSLPRSRWFLGTGVVLVAVALAGLAQARTLPTAVCCCALIGFGLILYLATGQSIVQLSTDDPTRGRTMAIWAMVLSGAVPLGNLLAGLGADAWGVPVVLGLQGWGVGAAAVGLLLLVALTRRSALG